MRLPDGLDLVLDGEDAPTDDPEILDTVGALVRQSGWPVELADGGFAAPFGPCGGGPPPWRLYRFVFHEAIGQATRAPPNLLVADGLRAYEPNPTTVARSS
jgi:hypothetical protein